MDVGNPAGQRSRVRDGQRQYEASERSRPTANQFGRESTVLANKRVRLRSASQRNDRQVLAAGEVADAQIEPYTCLAADLDVRCYTRRRSRPPRSRFDPRPSAATDVGDEEGSAAGTIV